MPPSVKMDKLCRPKLHRNEFSVTERTRLGAIAEGGRLARGRVPFRTMGRCRSTTAARTIAGGRAYRLGQKHCLFPCHQAAAGTGQRMYLADLTATISAAQPDCSCKE